MGGGWLLVLVAGGTYDKLSAHRVLCSYPLEKRIPMTKRGTRHGTGQSLRAGGELRESEPWQD